MKSDSVQLTLKRKELISVNPTLCLPLPTSACASYYYSRVDKGDGLLFKNITLRFPAMPNIGLTELELFFTILNCSKISETDFLTNYHFNSISLPDLDFLLRFKVEACPGCSISQIILSHCSVQVPDGYRFNEMMFQNMQNGSIRVKLTPAEIAVLGSVRRTCAMKVAMERKLPSNVGRIQQITSKMTPKEIEILQKSVFNPEKMIQNFRESHNSFKINQDRLEVFIKWSEIPMPLFPLPSIPNSIVQRLQEIEENYQHRFGQTRVPPENQPNEARNNADEMPTENQKGERVENRNQPVHPTHPQAAPNPVQIQPAEQTFQVEFPLEQIELSDDHPDVLRKNWQKIGKKMDVNYKLMIVQIQETFQAILYGKDEKEVTEMIFSDTISVVLNPQWISNIRNGELNGHEFECRIQEAVFLAIDDYEQHSLFFNKGLTNLTAPANQDKK